MMCDQHCPWLTCMVDAVAHWAFSVFDMYERCDSHVVKAPISVMMNITTDVRKMGKSGGWVV